MNDRPAFHLCVLDRPGIRYALCVLALLAATSSHAQTYSSGDPTGDITTPQDYFDLPLGGQDVRDGNQFEWTVPNFLLENPVVDWRTTSLSLIPSFAIHDAIPDSGFIMTTGGNVADTPGDQAVGIRDLTNVAILEGAIDDTFQITVRDATDLPGDGSDTRLFFSINHGGGDGSTWRRSTGLVPQAPSVDGWAVVALGGQLPFPFTAKPYYDITTTRATLNSTHLVIELDLAGKPDPIPSEVQETPSYTPAYNVGLDVDGNPGTGPFGTDYTFAAYYDQNGLLQGSARVFNGSFLELTTPEPTVSRSDGATTTTITIQIPRAGLTGFDPDLYSARTSTLLAVWSGTVEPADNAWFNTTDAGPVLTPVIFRGDFESGGTGDWN